MKILDCTLRDGGHAVNFDWPIFMAQEYYKLMIDVGVDIIELGYWKQTSKTSNSFYNLNMETVKRITDGSDVENCAIMIDYHYCTKNLSQYPKAGKSSVKLIRMCSRKEDVNNALLFAHHLKDYTGLEISFNAFNISNYTAPELLELAYRLSEGSTDYVYFADTHGALDLQKTYGTVFKPAIKVLRASGKKIGLHFHNHTGKEYANYLVACQNNIDMCDTTVFGIGKGAGNLRLEHVMGIDTCLQLMLFIDRYFDLLSTTFNPYYYISGYYGICETYAVQAERDEIKLPEFYEFCVTLKGLAKDTYDKTLLD